MINKNITEIGYLSVNHVGEELCGDHIEVVTPDEDTKILVLADGLGSGVKANILSTLTSEMLSTMMANGLSIKECVETIAETLPVCAWRKIAYSTFTLIKVVKNTYAEIYNYDNPLPFLIRNGKAIDIPYSVINIGGKEIYYAKVYCSLYDTFFLMSDGAIHAGIGQTLNFGWELDDIKSFMEANYHKSFSAKALATILVDKCNELYNREPGDDTSVAVVRIRERKQANLLIGPPANKEDDKKVLSLFFAKDGDHIVCGGSTSNMVAKYLNKNLELALDYVDKDVPPISKIEGVDLVTEGVITINKVLDYAKNVLDTNSEYFSWCYKQDGASLISQILFEDATDINFFVGGAINPAHQHEGLPIDHAIKMKLVDELIKLLKQMDKNIKVSYF